MTGGRAAARPGLSAVGLDAVALKPTECALGAARALSVDRVVVDYEGRDHVPRPETLADLARDHAVRVTTPVRADGFDPLGDDSEARALPEGVDRVLVAGHEAYLAPRERRRAVARRLRAGVERHPTAWVGTEGVERLALATGAAQFDLLTGNTERETAALRAAGFEGTLAVYAPVVLDDDAAAILDAVGEYAARRGAVASALPRDAPRDASATDRARETLLAACREFALVGAHTRVSERIAALHEAGVDRVVGYPARGIGPSP